MRGLVVGFLMVGLTLAACDTAPGEAGCLGGDCEGGGANGCDSDEYRVSGGCKALTECTSAQYQLIAPTASSDRVCDALTTCRSTQYERKAPTATSDRECKSLTECRRSQFEAAAATDTSDRVCKNLTACARDEFESQAATDTSDRTCTKLTVCAESEYEAKAPTATSDRVCAPDYSCPASSYQASAGSATTAPTCRPLTACKSNEYESQAATATADRVCTRLTECTGAQEEIVAPTATSDRVCGEIGPCGDGFYETEPATATRPPECKPVATCTALQYEVKAPTATSNRICALLTTCRSNQWESVAPTATSNRECTTLTECASDQSEITPPTPTSDRVCCGDVDMDMTCDDDDDQCAADLPGPVTVTPDPECLTPDIVVEDPWNLKVEAFIDTGKVGSASAPLIANLDDDNDDGLIDDRDTPELIYKVIGDGIVGDGYGPNELVARHADGSDFFRRTDIYGLSTPLIADIDLDGAPEIVDNNATSGQIVALSADGQTVEWASEVVTSMYGVTPTVGDVNGDGQLEVVVEGGTGQSVLVLDGATGALKWSGTTTSYYSTPVVADLDRDGSAEVAFGPTLFAGDGTVRWQGAQGTLATFNAVANVDDDPNGELLSVSQGLVTIVEANGTVSSSFPIHSAGNGPGPACIADFDGDGESEIGIPVSTQFQVYEFDGSPVWEVPATIQDYSGIAGCSGYDIDGDGRYEVLFADENTFWIFDGLTGAVNFSESAHSSGTLWEYPTIADYDKDGSAEVFIASNTLGGPLAGIVIYGHAGNGWARAGSTWAIHDFAPGKIGSDNTVALGNPQPWEIHNNYRARPTVETAASDLRISLGDSCTSACRANSEVNVSFRVSNHGKTEVPAGVVVGLYMANGESPIATVTLDEAVVSGGTVSGVVTTTLGALGGATSLVLRVDPDGAIGECNRSNNAANVNFGYCAP